MAPKQHKAEDKTIVENTLLEPKTPYKQASHLKDNAKNHAFSSPKSTSGFSENVPAKTFGSTYDKKAGELYQSLMSIPVAPEDKKPLFPERNPISSPQISSQPVAKKCG